MILLRTMSFSAQTAAFARRLARESGEKICFVVDERKGEVDVEEFDKICLTEQACRDMGLHATADVGWRCGDYGFYFARRRFPAEQFFWLIENDVRIAGPDTAGFFRNFAAAGDVDLIVSNLRIAETDWFWTPMMAARGESVWRCLFPVVRLSAKAVDILYRQRRALARNPLRRAYWANDESFVSTILARSGARCADLNDFGQVLYDGTTFTYEHPIDGDKLDQRSPPLRIYHPVLFADELRRKSERMIKASKPETGLKAFRRRVVYALNRRLPA